MKKLLLFILFCTSILAASAQGEYYIYLQSENNQPFYVKTLDKIWSSSPEGYILLPNLQDSVYSYIIGFPRDGTKESKFSITLNGNDKGYIIKAGENGMVLWDLQNATTLRPEKNKVENNFTYIQRTDAFSALLARAAQDTTLLYEAVAVKRDVAAVDTKPEETIEVNTPAPLNGDSASGPVQEMTASNEGKQDTVKAETAKAETGLPSKEETKQDDIALKAVEPEKKERQVPHDSTAIVEPPVISTNTRDKDSVISVSTTPDDYKRSVVKKHGESSTSEGFGLVFHDKTGEGTDTIRLLIPNPKYVIASPDTAAARDSQFFLPVNKDSLQKGATDVKVPVVAVSMVPASTCKSIASEKDFFKLRLNMASRTTDEDMVSEAKKGFKSRCYTTEQIKNLSALFLTAAGKYLLFDAAYSHVSDRENFSSLQSQIKDDYYLRRFKALIGE